MCFHRVPAKPAFTDVGELAANAVELFHDKMRKRKISVKIEMEKPYAFCSAGEIRQALVNLIGNSFDATPEGGKLRIRVSHCLRQDFHYAPLTIADTGSGIPSEIRKCLFTQFFKTKGSCGTGLGLWLTRDIVLRSGASALSPAHYRARCYSLHHLPPISTAYESDSQPKLQCRKAEPPVRHGALAVHITT